MTNAKVDMLSTDAAAATAMALGETLGRKVRFVGTTVILTAKDLLDLELVDPDDDGHYDGCDIWFGGSEYAVIH